nr:MAG TPA: hypothetical protein [Caudoviricetes sp.]
MFIFKALNCLYVKRLFLAYLLSGKIGYVYLF